MMDTSDKSVEGVGKMFKQIENQLGTDGKGLLPKILQILEGNLGVNMKIESLQKKRHTSGNLNKYLTYVLSVLGAAHMLWDVAQEILTHHWGIQKYYKDSGAWKTWVSHGGACDSPVFMNISMSSWSLFKKYTW